MEDDDEVVGPMLDGIATLKQMLAAGEPQQLLQTKIVAAADVRKNLAKWIPPTQAELKSLFGTKGALVKISAEEVKRMVREGAAEILPSKMVCALKPFPPPD